MEINVRVVPNARTSEVLRIDDTNYRVRVDAPPTGGKANGRLVEILAAHFDVPKSNVRIIRGFGSRSKRVSIMA